MSTDQVILPLREFLHFSSHQKGEEAMPQKFSFSGVVLTGVDHVAEGRKGKLKSSEWESTLEQFRIA